MNIHPPPPINVLATALGLPDVSGKKETQINRGKAKRRKMTNEKKGGTFSQPSALKTASSSDKKKHVSISLGLPRNRERAML